MHWFNKVALLFNMLRSNITWFGKKIKTINTCLYRKKTDTQITIEHEDAEYNEKV